jgi:dihydrofolate reductase
MKLAIIVAVANNGVIGLNNQLPWHLPQDLKYFKAQTLGKPIIMGRKTYESIGRPLPGRINIVVTRSREWLAPEGVQVAHSFSEACLVAERAIAASENNIGEAMVIGGSEMYLAALEQACRIYLTRIEADIEGDAFFEDLSAEKWRLDSAVQGEIGATYPHKFLIYERVGQ